MAFKKCKHWLDYFQKRRLNRTNPKLEGQSEKLSGMDQGSSGESSSR